jgi:hypothetical protein
MDTQEKYYGTYIKQPPGRKNVMFLDVDYFLRKIVNLTPINLTPEKE